MCPNPLAPVPDPAAPGFSLTFPPEPAWVRTCREAVRTSTGLAGLAELAVLLTSEAATNAIAASVAAGCPHPITLCGEWLAADSLRIHVRDTAPGVPAVQRVAQDAEHGRGMYLIATLASRYGFCLDGPGPGKSFWFQLERTAVV